VYKEMRKMLGLLLVLVCALPGFSQQSSIEDVLPGAKGNPAMVQVYQAAASMNFGELLTKPREPVSAYRFGPKGQLVESVQFVRGNPVSYSRLSYDSAGKLIAVLVKDADGETTTTYSYSSTPEIYSTITRDKKGAILSKVTVTTSKTATQSSTLSRRFDQNETLLGAERQVKDSKGKTIQVIGYDANGEVTFLFTVSLSTNERTTQYYSEKGDVVSRRVEKLDTYGNPVSITSEWHGLSLTTLSNSTSKVEYKYDKAGNWVESVEYEMTDKFGGMLPTPLQRIYRDITYLSVGTPGSSTIEPKALYRKVEQSPLADSEPPSETDTTASKMTVFEKNDPFDDLRTVTFMVDSESGKGSLGADIRLVIRAKESNAPELYVNWQSYLGDEVQVIMRVDADAPEDSRWQISTDQKASFYAGDVAELLRRLVTAKRLVVKTTPYNESPITAEFDVSEFATLIAPFSWILSQQ
jgi:type VI secretion system protein VasI